METVALWVNRKPNKEFDLQMTGSQEVLFWYRGFQNFVKIGPSRTSNFDIGTDRSETVLT